MHTPLSGGCTARFVSAGLECCLYKSESDRAGGSEADPGKLTTTLGRLWNENTFFSLDD